jgi:competence protein ComEC
VLLLTAQAAGILLADRGLLGCEAALALGATSLGFGLACRRLRLAASCGLALAAGAGSLGGLLVEAARVERLGARESMLEGTVESVEHFPHGWRVGLDQVRSVGAVGPPLPHRVRLSGRATPEGVAAFESARVGDRLRTSVRLRPASGLRNPGGRDTAAALRRAGFGLVGSLTHPALHVRVDPAAGAHPLGMREFHFRREVHALRERLSDRLAGAGPGGGLLAALAVGDRRALTTEWREPFARLGVAHILAVSGLHLALVAALGYAVLRAVFTRCGVLRFRPDVRPAALAGACAGAAAYALLAGWGLPVRRALVLLFALGIGFAWRRPTLRLAPLGAAGIWILADEPGALFSPGAQLSFAASAALLLAAPTQGTAGRFRSGKPGGFLAGTLRTTATAIAVTAPLAAWQLGSRAPFALVANLVLVPWTALVLLPSALIAAAAATLGGAAEHALVGLAERVAWGTLTLVMEVAEKLPGATGAPPPAGAWLFVAVLLGALALRSRTLGGRVGWAGAVSVLLAAAPPPELAPPPPRAVFLDVGQGDAALVQGHTGAVLIDAGTALPGGPDLGRRAVVPALRALGVVRLDLAVASHADLDHRGGLDAVLAALPVGALWLPHGGRADPDFGALVARAARRGVPVVERGRGDSPARFGDLRVVPLWPPVGSSGTRNDRSLVVRVEAAGRRVLFAGDLESAGEYALVATGTDLASDVLKLAHHGSRSSSTRAFLDAVRPGLAVVSAPCSGRFAWPHPGVVARLRESGARLHWTGRDGAVWVGLGPSLGVRAMGAARRCGPAQR